MILYDLFSIVMHWFYSFQKVVLKVVQDNLIKNNNKVPLLHMAEKGVQAVCVVIFN